MNIHENAKLTPLGRERIGWPSRRVVQAPHCALPQPNLVPVVSDPS